MQRKTRFLVGGVLLVGAVGYLMYAAVSETSVYYLTMDEFQAKKEALVGEGVRIAGRVRPGTVEWDPKTLVLRFSLANIRTGGDGLMVHYTGVLPDMFGEGRDVIVEGKYAGDGVFRAHTILTSCPSKYEAEDKATGARASG